MFDGKEYVYAVYEEKELFSNGPLRSSTSPSRP